MAEQKRGADKSVEMPREHLRINPEAEQNPPQQEMDERHSIRSSAGLPYGLPTDDTHPTGTPSGVSSGFSDLRRGDKPHLEYDNAQGAKENRMAEKAENRPQTDSNDAAQQKRRKDPTYDAEKEMPDPNQVDHDIADAEKTYGDKGRKGA